MAWFAVRCVYQVGRKADGVGIFEERIVGFSAEDFDEAHEKAFQESKQYATQTGFERSDLQLSYEQIGDDLIDGYELWSQYFEAKLSLEEFVRERYERFDYHPE